MAIELVEDKQTRKPYPLEARIGHKVAMDARSREQPSHSLQYKGRERE